MKLSGIALAALLCVMPLATEAFANAVVTSGNVALGVDDFGQLNISTPGNPSATGLQFTGLRHTTTNYEATADGCLCEGWGVGIGETLEFARADNSAGNVNIVGTSFTSTASTATAAVSAISGKLAVTHEFTPSASADLYQVRVTITNTSGANIADLRYTRGMDWDIEPTPFNEFVTIGGLPATNVLLASNTHPFGDENPFAARPGASTGNFTDVGPFDHGAMFDFGFGALADGDSKSFDIFYGAADSKKLAFAALATVGAEVYSFGNANIRGAPGDETFIFGFKGVGGTPVVTPLPGAAWLLITGLGALGFAGRRRKSA